MAIDPPTQRNPYIFGQVTLVLGTVAVIALFYPYVRKHNAGSSADESVRSVEIEGNSFHGIGKWVAWVGLAVGSLGIRREKPPLLPIIGISMCGVVLCWHYIVVAFSYLAIGLFALVLFLAVFGDLVFGLLATLGLLINGLTSKRSK